MGTRLHAVRDACKSDPEDRTEENINDILEFVKDVKFFTKLTSLQQRALCRMMTLEEFAPREFVFQKGDIGDKFYIILTGSVSVQIQSTTCPTGIHPGGCECPNRPLETVVFLEKGMGFGELALQSAQPRSASIQTSEKTETLVTTRLNYEQYAGQLHRQFIEERVRFLRRFPQIEEALQRCLVSTQDIAAMANCLNERSLSCNETIVQQGDVAEHMVFVRKGQLAMHRVVEWDMSQWPAPPTPSAQKRKKASPHRSDSPKIGAASEHPTLTLARAMMDMKRKERNERLNELGAGPSVQTPRHARATPRGDAAATGGGPAGPPARPHGEASAAAAGKAAAVQPSGPGAASQAAASEAPPLDGAAGGRAAWKKLQSSLNTATLLKKVVTSGFPTSSAPSAEAKDVESGEEAARRNLEHFTAVSAARRKATEYDFKKVVQERKAARITVAQGRRRSVEGGGGDAQAGAAAVRRRVLRIGTLVAHQYFGDRQVCEGEAYPVSLLSDPIAEIYVMSKHDILRRLPKKLFMVLFTPDKETVPSDPQLFDMFRQTERWGAFCKSLHGEAVGRRYETSNVPHPLREPAGKSRIDVAANLEFLGVKPEGKPQSLVPPKKKLVALTAKDQELFSQCSASFFRKFDILKRDRGVRHALAQAGLTKHSFRGLSGPAEDEECNDFRFTQTWAKCANFPGLDLGDDVLDENGMSSAASTASPPPSSHGRHMNTSLAVSPAEAADLGTASGRHSRQSSEGSANVNTLQKRPVTGQPRHRSVLHQTSKTGGRGTPAGSSNMANPSAAARRSERSRVASVLAEGAPADDLGGQGRRVVLFAT